MIAAALRSRILSCQTISSSLALYDAGAGPAPAVFTGVPPPEDCPQPLVLITEEGGRPWGTRERRGVEAHALVLLRGDKARSDKTLGELAERLWRLLHRAELTLGGFAECGCSAAPPERRSDPHGFPEYRIRVAAFLLET